MSTVLVDAPAPGVAQITLNRPDALNAVDAAMRQELLSALCNASADRAIRVVVLTGTGRGFCAGADVKDMSGGRNVEDVLNAEYGAFLSVIQTCEKPVIAAINGPAAGIGMTIALTCDLRVMSQDAYLMSAFANIGLVPDGGLSWLLISQIGYTRAYQAAIEAEKINAERALDLGLVNRVAPADETASNAIAWAETLAQRSASASALTKRAFRAAAEGGLRNAMAYEAMLQRTAMASPDFREGVKALLEKRRPNFNA